MPKGNRTNHPSRAGIKLKPSKHGRTERLHGIRITPEALARLNKIIEKSGKTRGDWIIEKINIEYEQLFNLTTE